MVPRPLAALRSPATTFDGWLPSLSTTAKVFLAAAALVALGAVLSGVAMGAAYDATVTVPNPEHPPASECTEPDSWPDQFGEWTPPEECSLPAETTVDIGDRTQAVAFGLVPGAIAALVGGWIAFAGVLHFAVGRAERFGPTLRVVAVGLLPFGVRSLLQPIGLLLAPPDLGSPETLAALDAAVGAALVGWSHAPSAALSALAFGWAGYVWAGGLRAVWGRTWSRAVAGVLAVAAVVVVGTAVNAWTVSPSLLAVTVTVLGGLFVLLPGPRIMFETRIELIGMEAENVRPKQWYTEYVRLVGLFVFVLILAGTGMFGVVV